MMRVMCPPVTEHPPPAPWQPAYPQGGYDRVAYQQHGQQPGGFPQAAYEGYPPFSGPPPVVDTPSPAGKSNGRARVAVVVGLIVVVLLGAAGVVALGRVGTKTVTALDVGDCVTTLEESGSVRHLPIVECAKEHEGEVYFVYQMPDGKYPGDAKVQKDVEARCAKEINTYAGPGAVQKYDIFYLRPSSGDWPKERGVTCIATDARKPVTGSIRK